MLAYAFTIFSGAFLLFAVQPLLGKFILPWFGGGPGVWTTCLLFFQVLLLGGYAYAHGLTRWLKPRGQCVTHLALLALALALLPITPSDAWKPHGSDHPAWDILRLLSATVGVPYFLLSATGPLLQHWFSTARGGTAPYRLYALSNAGSLLALLSYPVLVEPNLSRGTQSYAWSAAMVLYALGCAACAWPVWRAGAAPAAKPTTTGAATPALHRVLWLLFPACATTLLMAITNKICQDVAAVPFLWVLPLAVYLLSFIICFDSPRWYARLPFTLGLVAALVAICWGLFAGADLPVWQQLLIYCGGLFICCMVCHGELYRLRPDPRYLTSYYLNIAAGGALGGVFVALAAPALFSDFYELHCGLFLCGLLFLLVCLTERTGPQPAPAAGAVPGSRMWAAVRRVCQPEQQWVWLGCTLPLLGFMGLDRFFARFGQDLGEAPNRSFTVLRIATWGLLGVLAISWVARGKLKGFRYWRPFACAWLFLGLAALGVALWMQGIKSGGGIVYMSRNFYGVLTVSEFGQQEPKNHHLLLRHGRITHGLQFMDPELTRRPTAYYGEQSGVGLAMKMLPQGGRSIGLVGLGTGTLTAYSQPGDRVRIYELNPQVHQLATNRFRYLATAPGKVEVVLGDARLSLEREPPQQFDLLVLDAFSSDAIPVHLLTREAFQIYQRHLKTNGVLAIHISNHYLDLEPVVANLARAFHYHFSLVDYEETQEEWWLYPSTWALLTRDESLLQAPEISSVSRGLSPKAPKVPLWTDDFASLYQILK